MDQPDPSQSRTSEGEASAADQLAIPPAGKAPQQPDKTGEPEVPPMQEVFLPGPGEPDAMDSADSLAANEALENIRRTMSRVTDEQAGVLGRLRELLQGAERSSLTFEQRNDAIDDAIELIDRTLAGEQDEFFRLRLLALRGEFDKARDRLDAEATMGS